MEYKINFKRAYVKYTQAIFRVMIFGGSEKNKNRSGYWYFYLEPLSQ